MKHNMLNISVIICTHSEARLPELAKALASVQAQGQPPKEIIVAVDHNDGLLTKIGRQFPQVVAVANSQVSGLAGTRNSGIAAATGEIVAFLDDDAEADRNWLARLGEAYQAPDVMGAGGMVEPAWLGKRPRWLPAEFMWVVGCTYRGVPQQVHAVRNFIGCNMSFRRELCNAIGGFQTGVGQVENSMLRCDETEFCIRLGQHFPDKQLLFVPEAKVSHRVPTSRTRWRYFQSRCFTEGLAKAQVTRLVGREQGLASERAHVLKALPLGIVQNLTELFRQGDGAGILRAGAIVAGLAFTVSGYVLGSLLNS